MEALMPYIATGWLALALHIAIIIHIVATYIFYRTYLEVIEDCLSDIALVKKHRDFYGNGHWGRIMREILIRYMIMTPAIFKKHEVIAQWKIQKLPPRLRFGVKLSRYSSLAIITAMLLLYYFRLRLGVR
jgi:hypothetical protein